MKKTSLVLILAAVFLGACKVQITAPSTGSVVSGSTAYDCSAGNTCEIDVVDLFFSETFRAEPKAGFVFQQWKRDARHFCGGNTEPCELYTDGLDAFPVLMSLLESDEVFYLEPVFVEESALKITLTGTWNYVQVDGNCTASGQFYQWVEPGEGIYQTLTPESRQVSSVNPCNYVVAGDFSSRTVGPISTVQFEPISAAEMGSLYSQFFGLPQIVQFSSNNAYKTITDADRYWTFTRVGN